MSDESEVRRMTSVAVNLVPEGAQLTGELQAQGPHHLGINGIFSGCIDLRAGGRLTVGPTGTVHIESLDVDSILILGKVDGVVRARVIELGPTAQVTGQLEYTEGFDCKRGAKIRAQLTGPAFAL